MPRGNKTFGIVDGVDALWDAHHAVQQAHRADGTLTVAEEASEAQLGTVIIGMEEWMSRFLIGVSGWRGFLAEPERTANLREQHAERYSAAAD